jgi:hypothetical protein
MISAFSRHRGSNSIQIRDRSIIYNPFLDRARLRKRSPDFGIFNLPDNINEDMIVSFDAESPFMRGHVDIFLEFASGEILHGKIDSRLKGITWS